MVCRRRRRRALQLYNTGSNCAVTESFTACVRCTGSGVISHEEFKAALRTKTMLVFEDGLIAAIMKEFDPTDKGELRDKPDCHFRRTATKYDRKSGIKWLCCTAK